MRIIILCCLLLISLPLNAKEIAGVIVQETVQTDDGKILHLNGAGLRSKFFFDIYIAKLYMENPSSLADEVIAASGRKRVIMHFLHDKVEKEKLVAAWNDGFKGNTEPDKLSVLQERINTFNGFFEDAKKGDVIQLDFIPSQETVVTIANQEKGAIPGKDFNDALLGIWLGKKPVTKKLKDKLLQYNK